MKTSLFMLLLLAAPTSWAATIQFSELGTPPIDANGVHFAGVQFVFGPGQAIFNEEIGTAGTAVLSADPVLTGPTTGILTLLFDQPTGFLSFDILLLSISPIDDSDLGSNGGPAYTVLLSNGLNLTMATAPQPNGIYSEGQFVYSGSPIDSATISFFNGIDSHGMQVTQFGLDNLTFGTFAIPEPATFVSLVAGLLLMSRLKRHR